MGKFIDRTNQRSGTITALYRTVRRNGSTYWRIRCDCGVAKDIAGSNIEKCKSCGCLRYVKIGLLNRTHGQSSSSLYEVWQSMRARCERQTNQAYKDYGGRGIKVCDEWSDYVAFQRDMGPTYLPGLTLDRTNNDLGYCASNCQWVTRKVQANNRRRNVFIETPKGRMTVAAAAQEFGVEQTLLAWRVRNHWPQEALFTSADHSRRIRRA